MRLSHRKLKIGIVGCGAIGSGIAKAVLKELKNDCQLTGLYDIDEAKAGTLEKALGLKTVRKNSLKELIRGCDLMVEAVNAKDTRDILQEALKAGKDVMAMSVGKILNAQDLFHLARWNDCRLLVPSGAIAGMDAVKAASLAGIHKITLTTRKPLAGFLNNPYLAKKRIDLLKIKKETVLYHGRIEDAVRYFPQNINVAATLALACGCQEKITVRIITSPEYTRNSHEIEVIGDFGRLLTRTENVVCPDNPKTSYLAVLSGIQTLKQYCEGMSVGT